MVNHILIPSFVHATLNRNKLPLSTVLNFNKMREILSVNDIALIKTLQQSIYWDTLVGYKRPSQASTGNSPVAYTSNEIYFSSDMQLFDAWYASASDENKTYLVKILAVLVDSGQANDQIAERLFNNNGGTPAQELDSPYEMIDIGPRYYGIIINSGVFPNRDLSDKLIKDILRSMYLYYGQHEVARTEFFRLYMDRL